MTKILLVEDDAVISEMYANKFKDEGFEIFLAKDGEEALAKTLEIVPDLVLLDVVLPKMDGFEVLRKIKENPGLKNIRIIFLTNSAEKEDVNKGMALGAEAYIVKADYTPGKVAEKVREILEKRREAAPEEPEFRF